MDQLDQRVLSNMLCNDVRPSSNTNECFIYDVGQNPQAQAHYKQWVLKVHVGAKPLFCFDSGEMKQLFISNMKYFETIKPWICSQSVLLLGPSNLNNIREAAAQYLPTGTSVSVGMMEAVPMYKALQCRSWFYDIYTGNYFTCV